MRPSGGGGSDQSNGTGAGQVVGAAADSYGCGLKDGGVGGSADDEDRTGERARWKALAMSSDMKGAAGA